VNDGIKFNDFQLAFSDLIKDEDAHSSLDASLLLIDNQIKALVTRSFTVFINC